MKVTKNQMLGLIPETAEDNSCWRCNRKFFTERMMPLGGQYMDGTGWFVGFRMVFDADMPADGDQLGQLLRFKTQDDADQALLIPLILADLDVRITKARGELHEMEQRREELAAAVAS